MQTKTSSFSLSRLAVAVAVLAVAAASSAWAAPRFGQPDDNFQGRISTQPGVILPGSQIKVEGSNFKPGQKVQLIHEGQALTSAVAADGEGKFSAQTTIPKSATPGLY